MKTKLIIWGLLVAVIIVGVGVIFYPNIFFPNTDLSAVYPTNKSQSINSSTKDWKTYVNTQLGFEFKYPSFLTLTTDAQKDKYCSQPYDYIFLQNQNDAISIRVSTSDTSCSWSSTTVAGYSFKSNNKTVEIFGTKESNFSKQQLESMVASFKFTK